MSPPIALIVFCFFFYSHHLSRFDLLYQVIFFSSQGCVPHYSLLFVFFFFQDVSTCLYVNLLFYPYHSVIFLILKICPHLSLLFVFFFLSRCLHLFLCKSFVSSLSFINFFHPQNISSPKSFVCFIFFFKDEREREGKRGRWREGERGRGREREG